MLFCFFLIIYKGVFPVWKRYNMAKIVTNEREI